MSKKTGPACNNCRHLKIKCDGNFPYMCTNCTTKCVVCMYPIYFNGKQTTLLENKMIFQIPFDCKVYYKTGLNAPYHILTKAQIDNFICLGKILKSKFYVQKEHNKQELNENKMNSIEQDNFTLNFNTFDNT